MFKNRKRIEVYDLRWRRNKSWLASAWLGIRATLWFAPLTLFRALYLPVFGICFGFVLLFLNTLIWAFTRVITLIVGLAGYLEEGKRDCRQ